MLPLLLLGHLNSVCFLIYVDAQLLDALSENCHAKFSSKMQKKKERQLRISNDQKKYLCIYLLGQLGAKSFAEDLESLASSKVRGRVQG